VSGAPEPWWWRRRRDLALREARDAEGRAAVALLELDRVQRSAASHLEFIADVDAGPTADRLRKAWTPVSAGADDAVRAYLEDAERFDVDTDLELEDAAEAAVAFAGHEAAMQAAVERIEAYSARFTADFVRVTQTLEQLTAQRATTEQAITAAHDAIVAVEEQGLRATRARELLAKALDRFRVVEEGPGRRGMETVLQACQDAVTDASAAAASARGLPQLREQLRTRMSSLRTRQSALEWQAEQGSEDAMRQLRRDFALGCSQDLEDNPQEARVALDSAREHLLAARVAAADEQQRWDDAQEALTQARRQLDLAQELLEAPRERLELLRSVSADPEAAAARARFVVRDAQKLLMAGPVQQRHATQLDALAERLERTTEALDRPHPDWLTYAHTLDAIADGARGLVVDIRASRAR
jgi:hypothetical protein